MKITIAKRFQPFSHLPGTEVLIPGTDWVVQAFPARLFLYRLKSEERHEVNLEREGPMLNFTVQQDLERERVLVFGQTKHKYHHLSITLKEEGIEIDCGDKKQVIKARIDRHKKSSEKLSFGMHKDLDWELVCRRKDLKEILPLWFYLGNKYPLAHKVEKELNFLETFLAGFKGILVPNLNPSLDLGIQIDSYPEPLTLLIEGAYQIRAAFFKEDSERGWHFLSSSLPEVDAGRFVGIETTEGDRIDLEWSKSKMRRMVIHPATSREVKMYLQKGLSSYRLRTHLKERGKRVAGDLCLKLEAGKKVYLDRFE